MHVIIIKMKSTQGWLNVQVFSSFSALVASLVGRLVFAHAQSEGWSIRKVRVTMTKS